ncbi:serine hydrolase domain-containing protein [Streptomyces sp. t39]|uniref:serine hydrolase domain-containing protein n=1 Tax=Streptomyces sp. t39 TaxID=1828156 RepID=UPI0011CE6904|nr:serine hydrolase domain-containing protein [Streptomyces sp. t39]TXS57147.1 class A beta-lactamase-related serine hydrolase [Streptomyces sp. t39]
MKVRTAVAVALALGLATGASALPAAAHSPASAGAVRASGQAAQESVRTAPDTDALRAAVDSVRDPAASGATAALVRVGGDSRWHGSGGVHDLRSGRPADPGGRFRAGSVTKVFTAAAVLQLADEGAVDLDRPVRAYLPELIPAAYGGVTVRQLLNHTSGIPAPDFPDSTLEERYRNRFALHDPRAMVRSATSKEPEFTPGSQQHYLNIGYTVAGLLIERVTGGTYEERVTERILRPLGLRDTYLPGRSPRIQGPHNRGYQIFDRPDGSTELRDVSVWGVTDAWAAGDLISTTADLERFTRALFSGRVVRGPLLEEMFTLPRLAAGRASYSVGLTHWRLGGRDVWGKTGGRWGYNAGMGGTRDLRSTLVYSVNSTDAKGQDPNAVVMGVITAAFGMPDEE